MVVDEVELVPQLEERQQMLQLPVAVADVLARGRVEGRHEVGLRDGIARGEEGDIDPGVDEAVGEELHDRFDAAVAAGRNREPDRAEQRDLHSQ